MIAHVDVAEIGYPQSDEITAHHLQLAGGIEDSQADHGHEKIDVAQL